MWLAATGVIRRAKTEEIVARRHFARGLLKRAVLAWRVIAVEEAARKSRLAAVLQQVTAIFSEGNCSELRVRRATGFALSDVGDSGVPTCFGVSSF